MSDVTKTQIKRVVNPNPVKKRVGLAHGRIVKSTSLNNTKDYSISDVLHARSNIEPDKDQIYAYLVMNDMKQIYTRDSNGVVVFIKDWNIVEGLTHHIVSNEEIFVVEEKYEPLLNGKCKTFYEAAKKVILQKMKLSTSLFDTATNNRIRLADTNSKLIPSIQNNPDICDAFKLFIAAWRQEVKEYNNSIKGQNNSSQTIGGKISIVQAAKFIGQTHKTVIDSTFVDKLSKRYVKFNQAFQFIENKFYGYSYQSLTLHDIKYINAMTKEYSI